MNKGDFIKLDYIGKTDNGEIFDLTDEEIAKKENIYNPQYPYKPIPVIVGEGFVVKGMDEALEEMKVGEEKEIDVEPEKGFGKRDPNLVRTIPEKEFKKQNIEPRPGLTLDFQGYKGRIQSVSGGRVRVDFNNPLAGRKLHYKLKVAEKIEDSKDKITSLVDFLTGITPEVSIKNKEAEISIPEGKEMPQSLQRRLTDLVTKHIEEIEKVKFSTIFSKGSKEESHEGHNH